jgi:glycosyltransferase involved in cell wall biosynthesis
MNQRRRTLHLISRLDGYGGARMLRYLTASQAVAGHQVIVAAHTTTDGVVKELRNQGVVVQGVGGRWPIDPIALGRLTRLRRKSQVDVVHTWDIATVLQAALTRRTPAQRLIASLDSLHTDLRWASRIVRSFRNRVDVFCASDDLTSAWLQVQGVDPRRIETIRPGAPRAVPALGPRSEWLAALGLPADAKVIAVAGQLTRRKNLDEAIWCYELVRVLHEHARMLVIGDGPDRARLESFAEQVSEPGCVRFLGYRTDMSELLLHADVFWQLDASSATPLSLIEATAAGVPVVASDTPAHRAAVSSDRTGLLVPSGSRSEVARATDELFANPERAERFGAAAANFIAEHWSLDAALSSYERLYDRLLAPPFSPRSVTGG